MHLVLEQPRGAPSRLSLPHALWRVLPAGPRRRALAWGAAALAPRPDFPPPHAGPGLAVAGEIGRATGLGEAGRLLAAGVASLGLPGVTLEAGLLDGSRDAPLPPPGMPLLLCVNAPLLPAALLRLPRRLLRGRRVIGYWNWELPIVPDTWRAGVPFVHEAWVASRFTADAMEAILPGRVRVVTLPAAVRPPAPSALGRAAFGLPEDAVVTLMVFNLSSSFTRKNPLGAVAAHRMAFGARPDRILVLKIAHAEHYGDDLARLRDAASDLPNVRIDTRTLPLPDLHALMAASDILLSLHRSEGFGLAPAEAMLLGVPAIVTNWSGTADFCDQGNAAVVPFALVPVADPRAVYAVPGAVWAEPDIPAAAAHLCRLADDPGGRAALGRAGQARARARLGAGALAAALAGLH